MQEVVFTLYKPGMGSEIHGTLKRENLGMSWLGRINAAAIEWEKQRAPSGSLFSGELSLVPNGMVRVYHSQGLGFHFLGIPSSFGHEH